MTPAADRARKEEALLKGVVWLGRGAVLLQHDRVVYFNPYNLREPYKDGDLVLITDPRPEHCSLRDVERALKPEGVVLTVRECAEKLGLGERAETPAPGERLIRRGLVIETLPAYLGERSGVPKERGWLGFVVDSRGQRYYYAGPSGLIPELKDARADVAFLAVGGSDGVEGSVAVEMAERSGAKAAVPIEWDASSSGKKALDAFVEALGGRAQAMRATR